MIALYSGVTGKLLKGSSIYGGTNIIGLGGLGASNPGIRANSTTAEVVRGDQAVYCDLRANSLHANVSMNAPGIGGFVYTDYTPIFTTTGTQPVAGNATGFGRVWRIGNLHLFMMSWTAGSTTTFGTGQFTFNFPTTMADATCHFLCRFAVAAGTGHWGWGQAASSTQWRLFYGQGTIVGMPHVAVTGTAPWTWAANCTIAAYGFYYGVN
jgi:hypothetical protein